MKLEVGQLVQIKSMSQILCTSDVVERGSVFYNAVKVQFACGSVYRTQDLRKITNLRLLIRKYISEDNVYSAHPLGRPYKEFLVRPCLVDKVLMTVEKNIITEEEKKKKRKVHNDRIMKEYNLEGGKKK